MYYKGTLDQISLSFKLFLNGKQFELLIRAANTMLQKVLLHLEVYHNFTIISLKKGPTINEKFRGQYLVLFFF